MQANYLDRPLAKVPYLALAIHCMSRRDGSAAPVEIGGVLVLDGKLRRVIDTCVRQPMHAGANRPAMLSPEMVDQGIPHADAVELLRAACTNRVVLLGRLYSSPRFLRSLSEADATAPWVCLRRMVSALGWADGAASLQFLSYQFGVAGPEKEDVRRDAPALEYAKTLGAVWLRLLPRLQDAGVKTLGQLGRRLDDGTIVRAALGVPMLARPKIDSPSTIVQKPRTATAVSPSPSPLQLYLNAVIEVVADLVVTDDELEMLADLRAKHRLTERDQARVHAKVRRVVEGRYSEDGVIDEDERANLRLLEGNLQMIESSMDAR